MDDRLDSSAAALEQWGARRNRMLDTYFRGALRERYEHVRAATALDTSSLDRYDAAADALRTRLIDEGLGGWPARPATISARAGQVHPLRRGMRYQDPSGGLFLLLQRPVAQDVRARAPAAEG